MFTGDIDDACNVEKLKSFNITAVVNVCSERVSQRHYWSLPGKLADVGIEQLILSAQDGLDFDIIPVVERAQGFINSVLTQKSGRVRGYCYGGVNRSGAVCAAYLARELHMPLSDAVGKLRKVRGTVLTNKQFVRQLVLYCSAQGFPLL